MPTEFDCAGCGARIYAAVPDAPPEDGLCLMCHDLGPRRHKLLIDHTEGTITSEEFKRQWGDEP